MSGSKKPAVIAALAALGALLVFLPSLRSGFVSWDDSMFLLNETGWRGIGPRAWAWALRSTVGSVWQPLAWLSYGLDFALWGLDARGYHLTNVLLHSAAAALAALVALEVLGRAQAGLDAAAPALFAALVFAVHPLRVESVSWVAERRDVLSGALILAALLAHLKGRARAVVFLHALALLAKGQAVVLPALLVIADFWPLRRKTSLKAAVIEKAPLWALSALFILIAGAVQERIRWPLSQHGLAARCAQACYGLVFYARKTLWPADLAPLYELRAPLDPLAAPFAVSALLVLAGSVLIWRTRARRPWLSAAAAFYAVSLSPVLGLNQFGPQLAADRYSYVACLPLALLAGAALEAASRREAWRRPALAAAALAVGALAAACVRQQAFWTDSEALWTRAASVDPASATARSGLGTVRAGQGRLPEAAALFEEALALDGACVAAEDRLADLRRAGAPEGPETEALAWEIEMRPVCRKARVNRAVARAQLGDRAYAVRELETIALAVPGDSTARANLARARQPR
ncbi:MAG: hypothetical protein HY403_07765 [Elusimicrobia bacterium]|nr:hypothetical protein [Elusimicrobiota bacterium]